MGLSNTAQRADGSLWGAFKGCNKAERDSLIGKCRGKEAKSPSPELSDKTSVNCQPIQPGTGFIWTILQGLVTHRPLHPPHDHYNLLWNYRLTENGRGRGEVRQRCKLLLLLL